MTQITDCQSVADRNSCFSSSKSPTSSSLLLPMLNKTLVGGHHDLLCVPGLQCRG